MANLKATLLDNCNRFTREALRQAVAAESNIDQWQFAILLMVHAVELALKERLHREHPSLIYENLDKPRNTVTIEKALLRLSHHVSSVQISQDDKRIIELARDWRNTIVHFEFDFPVDQLKSVFARLFGFLSNFYLENFNTSLRGYLGDDEWERVLEIKDYLKELEMRAEKKLTALTFEPEEIWLCIMCGARTFVIKEGLGICLTCHYKENVPMCTHCGSRELEWYTREIQEQMDDGESRTVRVCDSCYEDSVNRTDVT